MLGADYFRLVQIGNGSCNFQNPVIRSCGKSKTFKSVLERLFSLFINYADLFKLLCVNFCVAGCFTAVKFEELRDASSAECSADIIKRADRAREIQRERFHGRHFNMDIKTVEKRSRNAVEVAFYLLFRTGAFSCRITVISARTWVHCGNHHNRTRIGAFRDRFSTVLISMLKCLP